MAEYPINKGIGRPVEFKGLKAQYLFIFCGGLLASCGFFLNIPFFFLVNSGISPMNGTVTLSRSFLPRTRVFMFSHIKIMTTGISSPKAHATIKMFLRTGDIGTGGQDYFAT